MTDTPKPRRKPKGTGKRPKECLITVDWEEAEYAELQAAADQAGQTVEAYVRERVLAAPPPDVGGPRHSPEVDAVLRGLLTGAAQTAGYVDQLAVLMERGEIPQLPEMMRETQQSTRDAIAALMEILDGGQH